MSRYTLTQRKFAARMLKLAVRRATAAGNVFDNQRQLWLALVDASHKPKRLRKHRS